MQTISTNSRWFQIWRYDGTFFTNIQNKKVIEVQHGKDIEGYTVINANRSGSRRQRWRVVYTDKMGKEAYDKTGVTDKTFGFKVNTKFYFVSRLPMNRVAEAVGASNIVLKRYAKNRVAQQFFFDAVSKTIKSQQWKGRSFKMNGSNLQLYPTDARWW